MFEIVMGIDDFLIQLVKYCMVQIPISSMTIQSMLRIDLIQQRRQKDEQKCFLRTVKKLLRWESGS